MSAAAYDAALWRIAPALEAVHTDPRLALDPNYLAALFMKESGADTLVVSPAPAFGIAQLTAAADSKLGRLTAEARSAWPRFAGMGVEVETWPRAASAHGRGATASGVDSLMRAGTIISTTEHLFDPAECPRGVDQRVRGRPLGAGTPHACALKSRSSRWTLRRPRGADCIDRLPGVRMYAGCVHRTHR